MRPHAVLALLTAAYSVLPLQRSFALALGPLLVRVVYVPLWAALGVDQREAMGPAFWLGWGLPLLAFEVWRRWLWRVP